MATKPSKKPKSELDLKGEAISNYNSKAIKGKGKTKMQDVAKATMKKKK